MKTLLLVAALLLPSASPASDFADVSPLLHQLVLQARQVVRPETRSEVPESDEAQILLVTNKGCTSRGLCCQHWTAIGTCSSEYSCSACAHSSAPSPLENCAPSRNCCHVRTAGGRCIR